MTDESGTGPSTLHERLGGPEAIGPAVELFYRRVLADPAVAGYFSGVDMPRLIAHQKAFLSTVLDGPAVFTGRQLRDVHRPLAITDEAYDVVVDHQLGALRDLGVQPDLTGEVMERLERLRDEVVRPRSARP